MDGIAPRKFKKGDRIRYTPTGLVGTVQVATRWTIGLVDDEGENWALSGTQVENVELVDREKS